MNVVCEVRETHTSLFLQPDNAEAAVEWLWVEEREETAGNRTAAAASAGGAGVCLERV